MFFKFVFLVFFTDKFTNKQHLNNLDSIKTKRWMNAK